jgi:hypothetical protein
VALGTDADDHRRPWPHPTLDRLYKSQVVPCSCPARRRQGISFPNSSHRSSRGEGRGDLGDGELREDGDPRIEGRVPISMATWGSWSCRRCLLLGSMSCRWEGRTAAAPSHPLVAPPLERAEEEKEGRWPTGTASTRGADDLFPGRRCCSVSCRHLSREEAGW